MKLYNIYTIGHSEVSSNCPLPKKAPRTAFAECVNWGKSYVQGTGDGWEEISSEKFSQLCSTIKSSK